MPTSPTWKAQTGDSVAYVLMTALHNVSMLDRERTQATEVANALFKLPLHASPGDFLNSARAAR